MTVWWLSIALRFGAPDLQELHRSLRPEQFLPFCCFGGSLRLHSSASTADSRLVFKITANNHEAFLFTKTEKHLFKFWCTRDYLLCRKSKLDDFIILLVNRHKTFYSKFVQFFLKKNLVAKNVLCALSNS